MRTLKKGTAVRCERRGLGVVVQQAHVVGAVVVAWVARPGWANVVRVANLSVVG